MFQSRRYSPSSFLRLRDGVALLLVGVAAAEPAETLPSFFLTTVHWSRAYFEVLKLARVDTFSQSVYEDSSLATGDVREIPPGADRTYISFQDSDDCL